jgi:hypothetical protein
MRTIEKVLFPPGGPKLPGGITPLFSCHGDGCIRIWNVHDGTMVQEVIAI